MHVDVASGYAAISETDSSDGSARSLAL